MCSHHNILVKITMLNENEFYVTLFSNSSQDIYPENTMSRFTCRLPRPIKLEGNYRVGLVEIQYPPFQGVVSNNELSDEFEDEITLPEVSSFLKNKTLPLSGFIHFLIDNMKQPSIYLYERYFHEFMDYLKLDNFEENFKKYQSNAGAETNEVFSVVPLVKKFKSSDTTKKVEIKANRKYKLKEIVYEYLKYHFKTYKSFTKQELADEYQMGEEHIVGGLLQENMYEFIKVFKKELLTSQLVVDIGFYIAVHTDIIAPRIIGNSISKVLYFGSKKTNHDLDELYIQNVQYVPVVKNYIEEISFIITNENGKRILFESGYRPVSITLRFEKVEKL